VASIPDVTNGTNPDLLPQVGGLLAGVPTVLFATLHSARAGAIVLAVFLVYQQVENHVLVSLVMSRTVRPARCGFSSRSSSEPNCSASSGR
jgi:hypothetical protein